MKLQDALRGVHRLAFDTSPLIYLIEKHPTYFDRMVFIIHAVQNNPIDGVASVLVLTEVLVQPLRAEDLALAKDYEDIFLNSVNFRLLPVDGPVARQAAHLRAHYNLRTPDALHLATAITSGSNAFFTNDLALKRVKEVRVIVLDELELDQEQDSTS
jgi:predicted nucleic acid-binding protein